MYPQKPQHLYYFLLHKIKIIVILEQMKKKIQKASWIAELRDCHGL